MERNPHGRPGLPGHRSQTVMSPCHYHTCTVNIPEDIILKLERFGVIMYCRTSVYMNVNTARMTLFSQMSRNIDNIPPPQAALEQHIKKSSYQSGHVWGQSLEVQPGLPDVTDWGFEISQTAGYIPKWTALLIAEVACLELISCKCAKSCKGYCNCFKANLECTPLCKCGGSCYTLATGTMIRGQVSWYDQWQ